MESMNSRFSYAVLFLPLCASLMCGAFSGESALSAPAAKQVVAIQPLGNFDTKLVQKVKQQLISNYGVDVVVKPAVPLPQSAFYPPRGRYRAEKLLDYLDVSDAQSTKVLGLTTVDISTTKGVYVDWGILGQGRLGGRPCVVSTFRMRGTQANKKVSETVFNSRFAKVVAHEMGHTFGLEHCPYQGCLMEDARGTVNTVDGETDFCPSCKARLNKVLSK